MITYCRPLSLSVKKFQVDRGKSVNRVKQLPSSLSIIQMHAVQSQESEDSEAADEAVGRKGKEWF